MTHRISLGEYWNGGESDATTYVQARRKVTLLVGEVMESNMNCGGYIALDEHLSGVNEIALPCGSCVLKKTCLIGSNRKA